MSAEQLAPLLSPGNPRPDDSRVDESFVLPVLTALGGVPEVINYGITVVVHSQWDRPVTSQIKWPYFFFLQKRSHAYSKECLFLWQADLPGVVPAADIAALNRIVLQWVSHVNPK